MHVLAKRDQASSIHRPPIEILYEGRADKNLVEVEYVHVFVYLLVGISNLNQYNRCSRSWIQCRLVLNLAR